MMSLKSKYDELFKKFNAIQKNLMLVSLKNRL